MWRVTFVVGPMSKSTSLARYEPTKIRFGKNFRLAEISLKQISMAMVILISFSFDSSVLTNKDNIRVTSFLAIWSRSPVSSFYQIKRVLKGNFWLFVNFLFQRYLENVHLAVHNTLTKDFWTLGTIIKFAHLIMIFHLRKAFFLGFFEL